MEVKVRATKTHLTVWNIWNTAALIDVTFPDKPIKIKSEQDLRYTFRSNGKNIFHFAFVHHNTGFDIKHSINDWCVDLSFN